MIKITVLSDLSKLRTQKQALEYLLSNDINNKDREIHLEALKKINTALRSK